MKIYQIYYDEASRANCEPEYIHYYNSECTPFFENDVIAKLIEEGAHKDADYFGVVSHKLREKTGLNPISGRSTSKFSTQAFEALCLRTNADVISYNRNPKHDVCKLADRFHPNFSKIMRQALHGLPFQMRPSNTPIYFNHFVAKPEIWDAYTTQLLFPVMRRMKNDEALSKLLWQNSKYPSQLPINLQKEWNVNYYPYHSFICERLISIFLANTPKIKAISW